MACNMLEYVLQYTYCIRFRSAVVRFEIHSLVGFTEPRNPFGILKRANDLRVENFQNGGQNKFDGTRLPICANKYSYRIGETVELILPE